MHKNLGVPITAKIRVFPSEEKTLQYAKCVQDAGAQVLTVHGRTRDQKGPEAPLADWGLIRKVCLRRQRARPPPRRRAGRKRRVRDPHHVLGPRGVGHLSSAARAGARGAGRGQVKEHVSIPVIANGNIVDFDDVRACRAETHADAVMSAEWLRRNPAIFNGNRHLQRSALLRALQKAERRASAPRAAEGATRRGQAGRRCAHSRWRGSTWPSRGASRRPRGSSKTTSSSSSPPTPAVRPPLPTVAPTHVPTGHSLC